MDSTFLFKIFTKHQEQGQFMPFDEWNDLVTKAYPELIRQIMNNSYDRIVMTYSDLGGEIGLVVISDWFHLKIAWILYACAEYANEKRLPLITAIVVNKESKQPGKGFWGLPWIPKELRKNVKIEDLTPIKLDSKRDDFWVSELKRLDLWGKALQSLRAAL